MLWSKSRDTDDHVLWCLRHTGHFGPRFENDVEFAALYVWRTAMADLPWNMPLGPGLQALRQPERLVAALRDRLDTSLLMEIRELKGRYLRTRYPWSYRQTLDNGCCVLTCPEPAGAFVMNSLRYCDYHRGLALFNGLRHSPEVDGRRFCDACSVWNILALKTTMSDATHVHAAARNTVVPGNRHYDQVVHYRYFPGEPRAYELLREAGGDPYDQFFNVGPEDGWVSRNHHRGRSAPVPPFAWAYGEDVILMWILLERDNIVTGAREPVTRWEEFREITETMEGLEAGLCLHRNVPRGWALDIPEHLHIGWVNFMSRTLDAH